MGSVPHKTSFDDTIKDFAQSLQRRDVEDFRKTTLDELKANIAMLQAKQHSQRRQQDLTRLQPFLDAFEQYGKVVSTFYCNNEIAAFVWGPLKFLLQATSINDKAFGEVLDAYKHMGDALPVLSKYQDLFRIKPHMIRVLALIYECILNFECIILRYFQQPQWQRVFDESWKTCKSRFSSVFLGIRRHCSLIESQATPSQIEETQESIQESRQAEIDQLDQHDWRRFGEVRNWLRPTEVGVDQARFIEARAHYSGTGQWLLENRPFKEWFHPQYATIPPLLWLNGIPGAGKTILASLVVQKALELKPTPTVLYFYCKHENTEQDNFVALGRSLLAQFLHQDNSLLPTFYQKFCQSGEAILSSPLMVESLLTLAFGNCKNAYIILDGLDECPREERRYIAKWFRKLIEDLPNKEANRFRCLFVSQDDGPARKDFDGLVSIKIRAEDTQRDIEEYCEVQAGKLVRSIPAISRERADWIATNVTSSAKGIFLLAKLIWANLSNHTSIARLEEELEPNVFPAQINDAYRRIMIRIIHDQSLQAAKEDTSRLLSWLVCAKRPLKWHEIQVMNSINREEQRVDLERQRFIKSPEDLLAPLVEMRADGSVDFVHLSVKSFLLEEGHVVSSKEELKFANLCIDYLNLPAFTNPPTQENVLNGDYGFMEYAVLFWLQHLEVGTVLEGNEEELGELAESLEIFIQKHWQSPKNKLTLAKRHGDRLQCFKELPFYDQFEQAVASTKRQLKSFGNVRMDDNALNLVKMVQSVRKALERIAMDETQPSSKNMINERYGTNLFKCPRFSCQLFTIGFPSVPDRDKHVSKHERPFRCPEESCVSYTFGFSLASEREKHMRQYHLDEVEITAIQDDEFPTEEDVERSIIDLQEKSIPQVPDPSPEDESIGDESTAASEESESEQESVVEAQYLPRSKRVRQTEFVCEHCNRVYKRRYNLQSHLLIHSPQKPHVCPICGKGFARLTDLKRHVNKHTGAKSFVCGGILRNGHNWGCKQSFARADTLKKHHESRVGRSCIQPLIQEQENDLPYA